MEEKSTGKTKAEVLAETAESLSVGEVLAVYDRNDFCGDCERKVFLIKTKAEEGEDHVWGLLDEAACLIDEPEDGCPASGFPLSSVLKDIDAGFYAAAAPTLEEHDVGAGALTPLPPARIATNPNPNHCATKYGATKS